jgi:multimeric flavodoxin WrbA
MAEARTPGRRPSVVAVVGSPRRRSNTGALVAAALEELEAAGAACETIDVTRLDIAPCLGHDTCAGLEACPLDDDAPAVLERVFEADCLVLGSPVYFQNVSAQLKALIDRSNFCYTHERRLRARTIGLVAVTQSTGLQDTFEALRRFVALSSQGGLPVHECGGYADEAGAAAEDEDLLAEARRLGTALAADLGLTPA